MQKILLSLFIAVQGMFLLSCNAQNNPKITYEKSFLVDVRTPEEFREGSAPGAVNIPLNEVSKRLAEFKGKDQVVVFCRSGSRSSQAKTILEQNGFKNIINGGTWIDVSNKLKENNK